MHDPITARAFAIRSQGKTAVVVSVVAQGLFNTYIDRAVRAGEAAQPGDHRHGRSANHNESSPDTVGIYGGPATPRDRCPACTTGIDDYYMDFLVERIAQAADAGGRRRWRRPTLHVRQVALPVRTSAVRLSDNWPTTDNGERQAGRRSTPSSASSRRARPAAGAPIFTVLNLAAHNQEIGHSDNAAVAGRHLVGLARLLRRARRPPAVAGTGIFLVGDNGSEEDPITVPEQGGEGTYAQAQATGEALADATLAARRSAPDAIADGASARTRRDFCVPLENNLFRAAAAAGLFGDRQTYIVQGGQCVPAGHRARRAAHDGRAASTSAPTCS